MDAGIANGSATGRFFPCLVGQQFDRGGVSDHWIGCCSDALAKMAGGDGPGRLWAGLLC